MFAQEEVTEEDRQAAIEAYMSLLSDTDEDSVSGTEPGVTDTIDVDTEYIDGLPWPQSLQTHIDDIINESGLLTKSELGLMVYDLTADSVVYSRNAEKTLRPASTMKVFTAVTALDKLGSSYKYKTQLRFTGDFVGDSNTFKGDFYIIGGMDPTFDRRDIEIFIDSISALGLDTIMGNIYADRTMKDEDLLGSGWCWDDDNPVLSPLVYKRKDALMSEFEYLLKRRGIVFIGSTGVKKSPSGAELLCVRTTPIDKVLMRMMKNSDNLYAETMFYQIGLTQGAPSTAKKARKVMQSLISQLGLRVSDYKIADGSGLSLYNYLSAELEVRLLRYAFNNQEIYSHLYPSMPIAGVDGTLSKRMRGTKAQGNVHAKTGTVTGVSSLAGYVTAANGHQLCFSIINQGVLTSVVARAFQNKVCIAMTK